MRFQDFDGICRFWKFCKAVNGAVKGTYSKKAEFVFDFNGIMNNKDLLREKKKIIFDLSRFHKDRLILLGDLLDYYLVHR